MDYPAYGENKTQRMLIQGFVAASIILVIVSVISGFIAGGKQWMPLIPLCIALIGQVACTAVLIKFYRDDQDPKYKWLILGNMFLTILLCVCVLLFSYDLHYIGESCWKKTPGYVVSKENPDMCIPAPPLDWALGGRCTANGEPKTGTIIKTNRFFINTTVYVSYNCSFQ
eukprot:NODE_4498_length_800_cov_16.442077_g4160_i0.p1 GENE.NODE_4498_length_800_cov_16.442077_g4160_i0~~NODE_4498_length_800_cov_16.442077_g4160_i0.p1  ORF type:complete len:170 (+),score=8.07 NODE_4498_length_800_cov_16.442077_g4160_i0:125-634(+)